MGFDSNKWSYDLHSDKPPRNRRYIPQHLTAKNTNLSLYLVGVEAKQLWYWQANLIDNCWQEKIDSLVSSFISGGETMQHFRVKCIKQDWSTGHSCMCHALWGSGRQLAGNSQKIGNTLSKSGPLRGPQNFSSRASFWLRATGCAPLL